MINNYNKLLKFIEIFRNVFDEPIYEIMCKWYSFKNFSLFGIFAHRRIRSLPNLSYINNLNKLFFV